MLAYNTHTQERKGGDGYSSISLHRLKVFLQRISPKNSLEIKAKIKIKNKQMKCLSPSRFRRVK
jgi:hypothetical protein